jgi:hypothetical protein
MLLQRENPANRTARSVGDRVLAKLELKKFWPCPRRLRHHVPSIVLTAIYNETAEDFGSKKTLLTMS